MHEKEKWKGEKPARREPRRSRKDEGRREGTAVQGAMAAEITGTDKV